MLGYSRIVSRENDMSPASTSTRLSTVAKTGRRMQSSVKPMGPTRPTAAAETTSTSAPSVKLRIARRHHRVTRRNPSRTSTLPSTRLPSLTLHLVTLLSATV